MRTNVARILLASILFAFSLSLVVGSNSAYGRHTTQVQGIWGGEGPAIQGYDAVAYSTMGKAMKGIEEYTYEWLGANWQFVNAEHRDLFAADPTNYAPQHGGYCSVGATGGGTITADPEAWRIVDGRLYLFFSDDTASRFDPKSSAVTEADTNWQNKLLDLLSE